VSQLALLSVPTPPPPNSIDLRCCDVITMLADARGARLIVADPPWQYSEAPGVANPEVNGIYGGLPDSTIAAHLDAAADRRVEEEQHEADDQHAQDREREQRLPADQLLHGRKVSYTP
jgi:hypothetical protein